MYVQNKRKGNKTKTNKVNDTKNVENLNINQTYFQFTSSVVWT